MGDEAVPKVIGEVAEEFLWKFCGEDAILEHAIYGMGGIEIALWDLLIHPTVEGFCGLIFSLGIDERQVEENCRIVPEFFEQGAGMDKGRFCVVVPSRGIGGVVEPLATNDVAGDEPGHFQPADFAAEVE